MLDSFIRNFQKSYNRTSDFVTIVTSDYNNQIKIDNFINSAGILQLRFFARASDGEVYHFCTNPKWCDKYWSSGIHKTNDDYICYVIQNMYKPRVKRYLNENHHLALTSDILPYNAKIIEYQTELYKNYYDRANIIYFEANNFIHYYGITFPKNKLISIHNFLKQQIF